LLAFNKIVVTHPFMVAQQEDVIMECIDNPDITIRVQALNLVQGMVSSDNLMSIVGRLMRQLKSSASAGRSAAQGQEGSSDSDVDAEVNIDLAEHEIGQTPPLPDDYKIDVINRILNMCSRDNYSNLVDFEWYIDILTQLARIAPVPSLSKEGADQGATNNKASSGDVSARIGDELRSVAVKVKAIRPIVVNAAELILRQFCTSSTQPITSGALRPVAWIVGEYSDQLLASEDTLGYLLQLVPRANDPDVLASCLQATIKIFAQATGSDLELWTSERKAKTSLLLARILHVLEPLVLHPNLEVQERAVEFTELLKLTSEAVSAQDASTDEMQQDPPLLLTQAIPSLFTGWELNSVAPAAQSNVPLPPGLDLDEPIHPNLGNLLLLADELQLGAEDEDEFEVYYHQKPPATNISSSEPAISRLADAPEEVVTSYQASEESYLDADILARRKAERAERNKDDPFYIGEPSGRTGTSTPIHSILQNENGPELDIDAIPIMQLDLGNVDNAPALSSPKQFAPRPKPRQRIVVAQDENLGGSGVSTPRNYDSEANNSDSLAKARAKKLKQSLLQVDSSNLGSLSLEGEDGANADGGYDFERQKREDAEMAQAMKEVERLRLEMQRANERIHVAQGVEGTVVKKKKKSVKPRAVPDEAGEACEAGQAVTTKVKKKKKKKSTVPADEDGQGNDEGGDAAVVKPKKKKKPKPPVEIQDAA
jgi:AP-3 complex subunit delta